MTITRQKLEKGEEIPGSDPNFTYKIVECLDEGYYGIVYKGDLSGDVVAIKEYFPTDLAIRDSRNVVPEPLTNAAVFDENLETFKKEAVLLEKIHKHPNIVTYYDSIDAYETAYIVMEYVEGQNLSDYLGSKKVLQEEELKSILCPLLDALEWIHGKGIFHRDIKPANIVLRQDEENKVPVLVDFGAAQEGEGNLQPLICTYEYAPPELRDGGLTGSFTDIYELGMVCYEALTGKRPAMPREHEELYLDWKKGDGNKVDVSEEFKKAIEEALRQNYNKRPKNVQEWRKLMAAYEVPPTKRRLEPPKPMPQPLFKRPAIIAILLVVLLGVGGAYYLEQKAELERQQVQAELERQQVQAELERQQVQAELERQGQAESERQQVQAELDKFYGEVKSPPTSRGRFNGEPHLHIAARLNLPRITFFLLHEGADIHAKKEDGWKPDWTVLHVAAWNNAAAAASVLLDKGADVHAKDNDGKTPLHLAAMTFFEASEAVKVLLDKGADVNAKDNDGKMPLHLAVKREVSSEVVKVLLYKGADVHAKDNDGRTPLHTAAWWNNTAVRELLYKGADVHAKDNDGKTPLHWTARHDASPDASRAAKELLDRGADVDAKDNEGRTPLHTAAESGSFEVVQELCAKGADVDAKDNDGKTPEDMDPSPMVKQLFSLCRSIKEINEKK